MRYLPYCFIFILLNLKLSAQSDLAIGQWTTHLPFNVGNSVTLSDKFCYYATDYAILKISLEDFSQSKITRSEGLNGSNINCIYFHKPSKSLVIAYSDGLIDVVNEKGIFAVTDILNYNNIPIIKNIKSISYSNDESVFINATYGLNELNLTTLRFTFTVFTPQIEIVQTLRFKNKIFSCTQNGLYSMDLSNGNIVEDFSNWKILNNSSGINYAGPISSLSIYKSNLYCLHGNAIFQSIDGIQFTTFYDSPKENLQYISAEGPQLIAGVNCGNSCNKILAFDEMGLNNMKNNDCTSQNVFALQQDIGRVWYLDKRWGFRTSKNFESDCEIIYSSGPLSNQFSEILPSKKGVFIAAGGYDATYTYIYNRIGVMSYVDKKWSSIDQTNNALFQSSDMQDILHLAESPDGNKIYMSSFQRGLVEWNRATDSFKLYDQTNSSLAVAVGDPSRVRLTGLAFSSKDKSLWITDFLAVKPLVSFSADAKWNSYDLPNFGTQLLEVKVDQNGYKWIIGRESLGICVFDEGDPNINGDERMIILNQSNSNLPTNKVNTVEVDLDGDVWVGTSAGPIVFECGGDVFSGDCKGNRRKVDQNGIIGYLLETEDVQSIAVDGGNRKWFGTRNGIYVQSPSGEVQIHLFTKANSPLLDNTIVDLAIDPKTGDAWIGSAKGIQVYRSEATLAKNVFTKEISAFPNPVRPGYKGVIAIRDLARDARVKITDITGKLVYETMASGGTAIWNTKDYLGKDVVSGNYLVFANSTKDFDTSEALVTKIIIIR